MYPHGMVHENEVRNSDIRHPEIQLVDSRFTFPTSFNLIDLDLIDLDLIDKPHKH